MPRIISVEGNEGSEAALLEGSGHWSPAGLGNCGSSNLAAAAIHVQVNTRDIGGIRRG